MFEVTRCQMRYNPTSKLYSGKIRNRDVCTNSAPLRCQCMQPPNCRSAQMVAVTPSVPPSNPTERRCHRCNSRRAPVRHLQQLCNPSSCLGAQRVRLELGAGLRVLQHMRGMSERRSLRRRAGHGGACNQGRAGGGPEGGCACSSRSSCSYVAPPPPSGSLTYVRGGAVE